MSTWLLVANASQARIYETQPRRLRSLTLVEEYAHPESREKGERLSSDRPGHFQATTTNMAGSAHGEFVEPTNPKDYEHQRFARELADNLNDARNKQRFDNLIVVASPHFHGLINQNLNEHVAKMISNHINKDYTELDERELLNKLNTLV
ncbi:host attachment protein [Kineobactrum sediminis]|nr:host attachment protein [Kineobactrum sediminis]